MKRLPLLSLLAASGLAHAAEAIPDVVKQFSDRQEIKIIKKIDAPGGAPAWLGQYQDMGVTLFLTPDAGTSFPAICMTTRVKTSARVISRRRSTRRSGARCGRSLTRLSR